MHAWAGSQCHDCAHACSCGFRSAWPWPITGTQSVAMAHHGHTRSPLCGRCHDHAGWQTQHALKMGARALPHLNANRSGPTSLSACRCGTLQAATIPSPYSRDIPVGLAVHLAVRVKLAELQGNTAYCMIRDPSFSDPSLLNVLSASVADLAPGRPCLEQGHHKVSTGSALSAPTAVICATLQPGLATLP